MYRAMNGVVVKVKHLAWCHASGVLYQYIGSFDALLLVP